MASWLEQCERHVSELQGFGETFRREVPANYRSSGGDTLSHQDLGIYVGTWQETELGGSGDTWRLVRFDRDGIPIFARYYGNTVDWWAPEFMIREWLATAVAKSGTTRERAEEWLAHYSECAGREFYRAAAGRDLELCTPVEFLAGPYARYLASEERVLAGARVAAARPRPTAVWGECSACGARVPRSVLMGASLRSNVCPDCYDQFSD